MSDAEASSRRPLDPENEPADAAPEPYDTPTSASTAALSVGKTVDDIAVAEAVEQAVPESKLKRAERAEAIRAFAEKYANHPDRGLIEDMILTVCKLSNDRASRLGLKILAGAMKELRYAYKVFQPYIGQRKCTIFGSARTPQDRADYLAAVEFGRRISKLGWMVITGAGDGIMKAGHEGAGTEKSFGVSIRLPFETNANEFIDGDPKLANFRYFFTRKLMFLKEADAVVLFPGGFGTHDELFETLTLVQTGKGQPMPIVLVDAPGGTYWSRWVDYTRDEFLRNGLISPEDFALFKVTDDISVAVDEVTTFYKRYQSSRYVKDLLIIRLSSPLPEGRLESLNQRFASLCKNGVIEHYQGPPDENPEQKEALRGLRLAVPFNKRNYGRLRQLIDAINED